MALTKYKFSDLYEMGSGIGTTKEQAGHGAPFISFSTVFNNVFLPDVIIDRMDTSEEEQEKYSVKKGDILITRTSETVDELAMSSVALKDYDNATFSGFLKRLRPKQTNVTYYKYMAFYLRSNYFRKLIDNMSIMTLRASFNEEIFSYLYLLLPEYETQVKIGDLLYSIYEKIQKNNDMVENLKENAKKIYSRWFNQYEYPAYMNKPYKSSGGKLVYNEILKREIPLGWKVVPINEIANLYQPKTISEKEINENKGNYLVYGANGIIGNYYTYNHIENEIAITCRGNTCGNMLMTLPLAWITGNAMVVSPKDGYDCKEYLYHFLLYSDIKRYVTGSAQPQITGTNLSKLNVLLPDADTLIRYNKIAGPIRKQIHIISSENRELTNLLEKIIPLLVNGQLEIK